DQDRPELAPRAGRRHRRAAARHRRSQGRRSTAAERRDPDDHRRSHDPPTAAPHAAGGRRRAGRGAAGRAHGDARQRPAQARSQGGQGRMTPRAVAKLAAPLLAIVAATMLAPLVLALYDKMPRSAMAYGVSALACMLVALILRRL